jgi:3'-5' exoribonuclease
MTPEAMLLSALDDLEAKFAAMRREFGAAQAAGKSPGEVTEWVRSMERPLFNSQRWLAVEEPLPPHPQENEAELQSAEVLTESPSK